MNHTITHFEIPADEIERATEFYGKLFGWEFDNVGSDEMEYYLVKTVPINDEGRPTEQGVNGGMCKRMAPEQTPINYINIESVDEYMEKVKQLGGQVVLPKMPVPGMGWFAHCIDTEGNAFAIWEDDPQAG